MIQCVRTHYILHVWFHSLRSIDSLNSKCCWRSEENSRIFGIVSIWKFLQVENCNNQSRSFIVYGMNILVFISFIVLRGELECEFLKDQRCFSFTIYVPTVAHWAERSYIFSSIDMLAVLWSFEFYQATFELYPLKLFMHIILRTEKLKRCIGGSAGNQ